jgi:hypothetical protein
VTVDAGAGVPAQGRLERVVDAHGEDVGAAVRGQELREVVAEADEAVGPATEELPVDPDLAVHVDAVELHDDLLPGHGGEREALPVPADPVVEVAARGLALGRRVERPLDAPVVGQVERAPGGVVEAGPPRGRVVPELEAPAAVEGDHLARACRGRRPEAGGGEREQDAEGDEKLAHARAYGRFFAQRSAHSSISASVCSTDSRAR